MRFLIAALVLLLAGPAAAAAAGRAPQGSIALARAGTAAIDHQRFGDALEAFTKAIALDPGDASLYFGAGIAAFMLGQNDLAQVRFERALELDPNDLSAALWLGDLHYRAGRLAEAISVYETAQQHAPTSPELQEPLAAWRKEQDLECRFHDAGTEHFTALFEDAGDEPLAREVLERLEAAYSRIGNALGVYPAQRLTVVLYTREQYEDITRLAAWSAAAYDGRIRVPLADALNQRGELDRVLSHEFVHAVVAMLGGRTVPAWMNEGLATVLEAAGPDDAEAMPARPGARPDLSTLQRSFVALSRHDAEVAYASAARAVRRLIEQRGAPAVVALLKDLSRGTPFASAFHRRIAMRYQDFAALIARD